MVAFLTERTGLSRDELFTGLSERLPQVVDELTPDGRLPTEAEMQQKLQESASARTIERPCERCMP
jgi:uncharacterized protein YidB (DUF937 family)